MKINDQLRKVFLLWSMAVNDPVTIWTITNEASTFKDISLISLSTLASFLFFLLLLQVLNSESIFVLDFWRTRLNFCPINYKDNGVDDLVD